MIIHNYFVFLFLSNCYNSRVQIKIVQTPVKFKYSVQIRSYIYKMFNCLILMTKEKKTEFCHQGTQNPESERVLQTLMWN